METIKNLTAYIATAELTNGRHVEKDQNFQAKVIIEPFWPRPQPHSMFNMTQYKCKVTFLNITEQIDRIQIEWFF